MIAATAQAGGEAGEEAEVRRCKGPVVSHVSVPATQLEQEGPPWPTDLQLSSESLLQPVSLVTVATIVSEGQQAPAPVWRPTCCGWTPSNPASTRRVVRDDLSNERPWGLTPMAGVCYGAVYGPRMSD